MVESKPFGVGRLPDSPPTRYQRLDHPFLFLGGAADYRRLRFGFWFKVDRNRLSSMRAGNRNPAIRFYGESKDSHGRSILPIYSVWS